MSEPLDLEAAVRSQERCAALLAELAARSDAAAALVALFTAIASPACAWLEADLAVELFEEDDGVRVRVLEDLGGGLRERVLPPSTTRASLADLERAAEGSALRVERISSRCLLLTSALEDDAPCSVFEISETCLSVPPPKVASSEEIDRGWDELA